MKSLDFGADDHLPVLPGILVGAARDESPRFSLIPVGEHVEPFTTIRELAPLFSPNQLLCLTLSYTKVSIRLPTYLPFRHFKRKRFVEKVFLW